MNTDSHLSADQRGIIVNCPSCGQANRLAYEKLSGSGRCGTCKADVTSPGAPIEIDSADSFAAMVQKSVLPVLVDFWAPWCGPCRMVAPEVTRFAGLSSGHCLVAKVNTEDRPDIAGRFGIRSIPTFILFAGGREINRVSGGMAAPQMKDFVARSLAAI